MKLSIDGPTLKVVSINQLPNILCQNVNTLKPIHLTGGLTNPPTSCQTFAGAATGPTATPTSTLPDYPDLHRPQVPIKDN